MANFVSMDPITKSPPLATAVVLRLRTAIEQGDLRVGGRLPSESELSKALCVSRAVVREAVAQLKAEGLVSTQQGVGAFVLDPARAGVFRFADRGESPAQVLSHTLQVRAALEVASAELAALHRTAANIEQISAALQRMDDPATSDAAGADADLEFHHAISLSTQNPHFPRLLSVVQEQLREVRERAWLNSRQRGFGAHPAQTEHREIFDAIVAGDAAAAARNARGHLEQAALRLGVVAPARSV